MANGFMPEQSRRFIKLYPREPAAQAQRFKRNQPGIGIFKRSNDFRRHQQGLIFGTQDRPVKEQRHQQSVIGNFQHRQAFSQPHRHAAAHDMTRIDVFQEFLNGNHNYLPFIHDSQNQAYAST